MTKRQPLYWLLRTISLAVMLLSIPHSLVSWSSFGVANAVVFCVVWPFCVGGKKRSVLSLAALYRRAHIRPPVSRAVSIKK